MRARLLLPLFFALLPACPGRVPLDPTDAGMDASEPSVFVALARDFQGFERWPCYDLGFSDTPGHPSGNRTVCAFVPGPVVDGGFPIGTRMVKVIELAGSGGMRDYVAAVKRGGGFNPEGAREWEFFQLRVTDAGVNILARGTAPVFGPGDPYASQNGSCNDCHGTPEAARTDYVLAPQVQPAAFAAAH